MEKKFEYIQNITDKLLVKCYCPDEKKNCSRRWSDYDWSICVFWQ